MTTLDWSIVAFYMLGMIALSYWLSRRQTNEVDYYVGGRKLSWWSVGISTMATQSSAISFMSIPAFVALKEGGGLVWLQWELAAPLAMIAVASLLLPVFRKLELVSVYEYLELRYGVSTRYLMSATFLLSRGLAAGVTLYAASIVLSVTLGIPLFWLIVIVGIIITVYDTLGGMTAVVYSDVIQMVILLIGLGLCIGYAVAGVGSIGEVVASFPPERWQALDFAGETSTPFWACLFGGFFLYVSYYGADQSQVQRELSTRSLRDTRLSILFNGFARFPLVAAYAVLGIAAGALYLHSPELQQALEGGKPDYLIPHMLQLHVPEGVRAVIFAAILAAAMSSVDSYINSLSAATMRDFVEKYRRFDERGLLRASKWVTVIWGALVTAAAWGISTIPGTVVEIINKVGSCFYGPILAAFMAGLLFSRINERGVNAGVVAGVAVNLYLWLAHPELYWSWWNLTGFAAAMIGAYAVSLSAPAPAVARQGYTYAACGMAAEEKAWLPWYLLLAAYAALIFILLYWVSNL